MNATHLRIISCPREGGEMTGYNPDQQPKCRLTQSAFRDDRLKPFFSNPLDEILRGHSPEPEESHPAASGHTTLGSTATALPSQRKTSGAPGLGPRYNCTYPSSRLLTASLRARTAASSLYLGRPASTQTSTVCRSIPRGHRGNATRSSARGRALRWPCGRSWSGCRNGKRRLIQPEVALRRHASTRLKVLPGW